MTRFGAILVLAVTACGCVPATGIAPLPPASARAAEVTISKSDPPPGATDLGPLEAVHGYDCGAYGRQGTFEGAMIMLRNAAAARGANYVMLVATISPHLITTRCFDNRFVLQGIAYRVKPDQTPASPVAGDGCDPPCSPGYGCSRAVCVALCNPACGPDQVCREDRTCGPAEPADR